METANLNIRVDKDVKLAAEDVAAALGMNLSTAVNIFLRKMVAVDGIPFDVRLEPNAETRQALEDVRSRRNLSGPYDTAEAALAAMLED